MKLKSTVVSFKLCAEGWGREWVDNHLKCISVMATQSKKSAFKNNFGRIQARNVIEVGT